MAQTYTVSVSITVGSTYLFRYRAKNIHGWSDYSDNLELIAASVPTQITPEAITINEGTQVRISWTIPSYDGGKPITSYTIEVLAKDGVTYIAAPGCDGTGATVIANLFCLVDTSALRVGSILLVLDDVVAARISSTNVIGTSLTSVPNTSGAVIKTEPA